MFISIELCGWVVSSVYVMMTNVPVLYSDRCLCKIDDGRMSAKTGNVFGSRPVHRSCRWVFRIIHQALPLSMGLERVSKIRTDGQKSFKLNGGKGTIYGWVILTDDDESSEP